MRLGSTRDARETRKHCLLAQTTGRVEESFGARLGQKFAGSFVDSQL